MYVCKLIVLVIDVSLFDPYTTYDLAGGLSQ